MRFLHLIFTVMLWTLVSYNCYSKVTLLPHQSYVVDYLNKNNKARGLLIDHSLGAGKTFLALAFCESQLQVPVAVILPRFLKANWEIQMEQFGIKNKNRYQYLSFEEAAASSESFREHIVIIDEVHQLVAQIRQDGVNGRYNFVHLYQKVQQAKRILCLSGTPIFSKSSDISYILNLANARDILPLSDHEFRQNYTKISGYRSWIRGYFLESKWTDFLAPPILLGAISFLALPPSTTVLFAVGGVAAIPVVRSAIPLDPSHLREFDAEKISPFAKSSASFFEMNTSYDENYPRKEIYLRETPFSDGQARTFFKFADNALSSKEMKEIYADQLSEINTQTLSMINSNIQDRLSALPGAGRQIGNLNFAGEESPKFIQLASTMEQSKGPIIIYSNYYKTGLLPLAAYLDKTKFKGQYQIFTPDMRIAEQVTLLKDYNAGKIKILMLHPEITEGVSLIGTDQLHILEPLLTDAIAQQIIGRTIRYHSHAHLPYEQRRVKIFCWSSALYYSPFYVPLPYRDDILRREHMLEYYPEVNENLFSKGILEVDKNYMRKNKSPDNIVIENRTAIDKEMEAMKEVFRLYSIEKISNH